MPLPQKGLNIAIKKYLTYFLKDSMYKNTGVGSAFGRAQRMSYIHIKRVIESKKKTIKTLVVDDKDGLHSIPFANLGLKVVMYEPNEVYINGGAIDNYNIFPITMRRNYDNAKNNIEIRNKNFYESNIEEKYDFVYCYRSLHEKHNKNIPMKTKIRKLL